MNHRNFVAGADVAAAIQADKLARVPRVGGLFESEALCKWQSRQADRGVLGAELVPTVKGWSVRYDSGLQNFAILAGPRMGTLDGSLEQAQAFARKWVAEDPANRYAWMHAE